MFSRKWILAALVASFFSTIATEVSSLVQMDRLAARLGSVTLGSVPELSYQEVSIAKVSRPRFRGNKLRLAVLYIALRKLATGVLKFNIGVIEEMVLRLDTAITTAEKT